MTSKKEEKVVKKTTKKKTTLKTKTDEAKSKELISENFEITKEEQQKLLKQRSEILQKSYDQEIEKIKNNARKVLKKFYDTEEKLEKELEKIK